MLLFRPRDFLFVLLPLLAGNFSLSAFDIPVELPSGLTIRLSLDELHIDSDSYAVTMYTVIDDLEGQRFFSENPGILEIVGQSIQEKWGFPNFEFKLCEFELHAPSAFKLLPLIEPLTLTGGLGVLGAPLSLPSLTGSSVITSAGSTTVSPGSSFGGAVFYHGAGSGTLTLTAEKADEKSIRLLSKSIL
jgi:hypothetical protein